MGHPHDAHHPVDLRGGLFAEGRVLCSALRTAAVLLSNVVDLFFGLKVGVVLAAVAPASGLLAPPAAVGGASVGAVLGRGGSGGASFAFDFSDFSPNASLASVATFSLSAATWASRSSTRA